MPRARSRSSPIASRASPRAFSTSSRAPSGSRSKRSSAMPRSSASATRRACAPSCRSRSMRCSSAAAASTAPARVWARTSTRSSSCRRLGPRTTLDSAPLAAAVPRTMRGGQRQQEDADRHRQERVAPRVDLEEAEVRRVVLGQRPPPGRHRDQAERGRPCRDGDGEVRDADREQQQVPGEVLPRRRVREERLEAVQEAAGGRLVDAGNGLPEHERGPAALDPRQPARDVDGGHRQREPDQGDRETERDRPARHHHREGEDAHRQRQQQVDGVESELANQRAGMLQGGHGHIVGGGRRVRHGASGRRRHGGSPYYGHQA